MNNFDKGDKVKTPMGVGIVQYKRMRSPEYSEVDVYSVRLETKAGEPTYTGTIFKSEQVEKA